MARKQDLTGSGGRAKKKTQRARKEREHKPLPTFCSSYVGSTVEEAAAAAAAGTMAEKAEAYKRDSFPHNFAESDFCEWSAADLLAEQAGGRAVGRSLGQRPVSELALRCIALHWPTRVESTQRGLPFLARRGGRPYSLEKNICRLPHSPLRCHAVAGSQVGRPFGQLLNRIFSKEHSELSLAIEYGSMRNTEQIFILQFSFSESFLLYRPERTESSFSLFVELLI